MPGDGVAAWESLVRQETVNNKMRKKMYQKPLVTVWVVETQHVIAVSRPIADGEVLDGSGNQANDSSQFGWGGDSSEEGEVSDAKNNFGSFNAWDNLPGWD